MNDELGTMNNLRTMNDELRTMNDQSAVSSSFIVHRLSFHLAPNPATTEVQISLEGLPESGGQLTVFDAQGRVVWQQSNVLSPTASINVSDLPSGLYQVRLQTENGVVTKGLVVSRL
jgi:hypothetical protein